VTITGTNLTGATAVQFNGTSTKTFTVDSATQITATVPNKATTGPINVTTPGGTATSSGNFTIQTSPASAPTITGFTPTSGPIGQQVTVTGTNLTGATAVKFNGTTAKTFSVDSATQVTATVPTNATSGTISITTPGGTAVSTQIFTVVGAPTITSFVPTSGPVGQQVTIAGTNLTGATAVKFNRTAATNYTVDSSVQVTATVPDGTTSGPISITTPSGTATSSSAFTVTVGAVQACGPISTDTTWSPSRATVYDITCTVTIPAGVTLTIEPGTVVKVGSGLAGIGVEAGGSLQVVGTSASPVVFTSINDNSVGGSQGNGSPAPGDYSEAIYSSGTISVTHAVFRYGGVSVAASGQASVTNSEIDSEMLLQELGVDAALTITGNTFNVGNGDHGRALYVQGSSHLAGIAFTGSGANTFTGADRVVDLETDSLPSGVTWTLSPSSGAVYELSGEFHTLSNPHYFGLTVDGTLTLDPQTVLTSDVLTTGILVDPGATVSLSAGVIMKMSSQATAVGVQTGGSLQVVGTSASPVVFTSINDNSVGGSQGNGSPAPGDYSEAIYSSGTISVTHAVFRYGGVSVAASGQASVTNSEIDSEMLLQELGVDAALTITGNTFNVGNGDHGRALYVQGSSHLAGIAFTGSGANTFTGADRLVDFETSTLPAGTSWTLSPTSGAIYEFSGEFHTLCCPHPNGLTVQGDLTLNPKTLVVVDSAATGIYVTQGATATLDAGTVFKMASASTGIEVASGGTLLASGSSTDPIVYTSIEDDSILGDTNADGPTTGTPGDYATGVSLDRPSDTSAQITSSVFKYSDTAIHVGTLTVWHVHGNEFAYNRHSFGVDTTDFDDPTWDVVPCAPRYTTYINASDNYYRPGVVISGLHWPGLDVTPSDYAGIVIPSALVDALSFDVGLLANYPTDVDVSLGGNAIPSALYSCLGITFPVFAADPIYPSSTEPFPSQAAG
jgi:hypothetical protein